MKKLKTVKLGLTTETIRQLTSKQLAAAAGGALIGVSAQTIQNDTARCKLVQ